MSKGESISAEALRNLLSYNPEVGEFRWAVRRGKMNAGQPAGTINGMGYHQIMLNRKLYLSHRLAWLYVHGKLPDAQIDHINGVKSDYRICNLRECSHGENHQNRGKQKNGGISTSEFHGVSRRKDCDRWKAEICVNGKRKHLGLFIKEVDAKNAYLEAKRNMHPFSPSPRDIAQ